MDIEGKSVKQVLIFNHETINHETQTHKRIKMY